MNASKPMRHPEVLEGLAHAPALLRKSQDERTINQ
jgi:hypothetical protein